MKTLAIRLDDDLHAQLSVLAQLRETTITDEIRRAIDAHIEAAKSDSELQNRGQAVLDDIERDAKARQAAIASMFGTAEQPGGGNGPQVVGRPAPRASNPRSSTSHWGAGDRQQSRAIRSC